MSKRPFNKKKPQGKSQARGPTLPSSLGLSNASSSKSKPSTTGPKSKAKSDAAGYAARKARKPSLPNPSGDIYEHIQPKNRRSRIQASFTRDELTELGAENGFDPDGADDDVRERMRARLVGEFDDDDEPTMKRGGDDDEEEEDEELDSDVAFDEEDEDRFAGFFSAKVCLSILISLLLLPIAYFQGRNLTFVSSFIFSFLSSVATLDMIIH